MTIPTDMPLRFIVRAVGGPTAILEIGGLRLLTDPTFDAPGDYVSGSGNVLTKTAGPAFSESEVSPIELVLLSHDQHVDNLDTAGRAFLSRVPLIVTTASAAGRLGGESRALGHWEHVDVPCPGGGTLRITGVPAQHGPDETAHLMGEVTGFVLSGTHLPVVYVSGDNASLDVVRGIAAGCRSCPDPGRAARGPSPFQQLEALYRGCRLAHHGVCRGGSHRPARAPRTRRGRDCVMEPLSAERFPTMPMPSAVSQPLEQRSYLARIVCYPWEVIRPFRVEGRVIERQGVGSAGSRSRESVTRDLSAS